MHKAKKGARLLQTCDKFSAFSQGLWGRGFGRGVRKGWGSGDWLRSTKKIRRFLALTVTLLINSILIEVVTSANMPACYCAKDRATRGAFEPIAVYKAIMQCAMIGLSANGLLLVLGFSVGHEESVEFFLICSRSLGVISPKPPFNRCGTNFLAGR